MTNTKKSLIASGISLAVSVALLVGSTFAWFTDSVTNKGNKIQAGNLKIGAYAYDLDMDGTGDSFTIEGVNGGEEFTFEAAPQDLKTDDDTPIISETLWEPGKSSAKLLQVVNEGTLAAEIKLSFETSGELTNALWFDFVKVDNGKITGKFEKRPMSTLGTFAANVELPIINKGDTLQFILVYGMYEEAGNEYKDKDFTADVTILAKQYTYEKDGFGSSDYDEKAVYPVTTAEQVKDAIANAANGDTILLSNDLTVDESTVFVFDDKKELTLDLNGKTLEYKVPNTEKAGVLVDVSNGATLTLENGSIEMDKPYYGLLVKENSKLTLNGIKLTSGDGGIFSQGKNPTVEIDNCELSAEYYAVYHNGSYAPANITIRNTKILKGGVYVSNSSGRDLQTLTIEKSVIYGATAVEIKHTNATITGSTLVGTTTPTGSVANGNGGCTEGYSFAVTTNGVNDKATGTVVVSECEFLSGEKGENPGECFVYELAEGASVTIDGNAVTNFNSYDQ